VLLSHLRAHVRVGHGLFVVLLPRPQLRAIGGLSRFEISALSECRENETAELEATCGA